MTVDDQFPDLTVEEITRFVQWVTTDPKGSFWLRQRNRCTIKIPRSALDNQGSGGTKANTRVDMCCGRDGNHGSYTIAIADEPNDAWQALRPLYFSLKVRWALNECRNGFRRLDEDED